MVRLQFSVLSSRYCPQRVNFQLTTAHLMQAHQTLTSTTTWKETEAWSAGLLFLSLSSARRPSLAGEVERVLLGDSARPSAESCTTAAARTLAQTVVTSCTSGSMLLISTCHKHWEVQYPAAEPQACACAHGSVNLCTLNHSTLLYECFKVQWH